MGFESLNLAPGPDKSKEKSKIKESLRKAAIVGGAVAALQMGDATVAKAASNEVDKPTTITIPEEASERDLIGSLEELEKRGVSPQELEAIADRLGKKETISEEKQPANSLESFQKLGESLRKDKVQEALPSLSEEEKKTAEEEERQMEKIRTVFEELNKKYKDPELLSLEDKIDIVKKIAKVTGTEEELAEIIFDKLQAQEMARGKDKEKGEWGVDLDGVSDLSKEEDFGLPNSQKENKNPYDGIGLFIKKKF